MISTGGSIRNETPAADVCQVELDGRISLFAPSTDQILSLNETATAVWRLCDGTRTRGGIVDELATVYGLDAQHVDSEVRGLLETLRAAGALRDQSTACP